MPNLTFNPNGDWLNEGWALVGTGIELLNQALAIADDLKYIKSPASKSGAAVTFPTDTTQVPEGAVITSITIKLRCSTGTGSAPAGAAPSITVAVAAQDDPSKYVLRTIFPTSTITTYEIATYTRDALGFVWDIFRLNQIVCRVFNYLGIFDLIRCHQLFCEVKYRVRPTVQITSPTGTVLTPSPTIAWSYVQADGDPQAKAVYKIFTADQVAQVSFNPETTNPIYTNTLVGSATSFILPTSINPNSYFVYIQSHSTFKAKSVWTGRQFVVSGPSPGAPGVNDPLAPGDAVILVVPNAQQGSTQLTLQDTSNLLCAQDGDAEYPDDNSQMLPTNAVLARDTSTTYPGGTSSWKLTASSAATMAINSDWIEVSPGVDITARAQFRSAVTARSVRVLVDFYDESFVSLGATITGTSVADATGTWVEASVTGMIPNGSVYAKATYQVLSPANAEVHNVDHLGVHYGMNTPWSDGGHASRNLLSAWYSSPDGSPQAGEAWTAGAGTTTTTAAVSGTGSSGVLCNKMTYGGLSPSIALRAAGTVFTSPTSGANFTLNKPAGTASGDLMIAYVSATGYVTMQTVPVGWTLVNQSRVSDGSTESLTLFVLKRTAGGAEPASWTDGTISAVAGCRQAVVVGYSGAADATEQFIADTQVGTGNATPLSLTTSAITNNDSNAWRVSAFAVSDNVSTGTLTANRIDPALQPSISYVGAATSWSNNTSGSYTFNKPSGVVSGDLMIAAVASVTTSTVTAPAGWTIRYQGSYNSNGGPSMLCVMWRIAGGSEPSSWSGTYSGGSNYGRNITQAVAYRNVNATTPFIDSAGNSINGGTSFNTPSITNTNSRAWRVTAFAGLTTNANTWSSTETSERNDNNYKSGSGTESLAMYDSNSPVGTGSHQRTGTPSQSTYAVNSFIGLLNPVASVGGVSDETARFATSSIGSANPYLHLRAFDSNGVTALGAQSLSGIWAPTTGTDKNSMTGWQGLIKPAAAVTAGYSVANMATTVDLALLKMEQITEPNKVAVTASFLGSTAGTPYLTVYFYRANVLLNSLTAPGASFGTGTWVKSSAVFDVPVGTTRMKVGVSVSDRAVSDIVYWDRISLAFGSDVTYRKATSRQTHPVWGKPQIQYADDDGTGYSDWFDLPGLLSQPPTYNPVNGFADYVDHTPIPLTNRKYRARTVTIGLAGDQFVSDYGPDSQEVRFEAENWWLKDLNNPDDNIQLDVKWDATKVQTSNTATSFQPIGEDLPVVLSEGYKGDTFSLVLTPVDHAGWVKLKQMLKSGRTLFLQSDIDQAWWIRPIGELSQSVLPTGSRKSNPLREVTVQFVEVAPPV